MNILSRQQHAAAQRQRGAATIELAVIILFMFYLLINTVMYGRMLWQYNVLKHAVNDAARYIETVPTYPLESSEPDPRLEARMMVARAAFAAGLIASADDAAFLSTVEAICLPTIACRTRPDTAWVGVDVVFTTTWPTNGDDGSHVIFWSVAH